MSRTGCVYQVSVHTYTACTLVCSKYHRISHICTNVIHICTNIYLAGHKLSVHSQGNQSLLNASFASKKQPYKSKRCALHV